MAGDWLDNAEVLVLQPLEDSPQPLWALRWHEETTLLALAAFLAPGVISLEARGLVEVRRFRLWPARWEDGEPLTGGELARESNRAEIWSKAVCVGRADQLPDAVVCVVADQQYGFVAFEDFGASPPRSRRWAPDVRSRRGCRHEGRAAPRQTQ